MTPIRKSLSRIGLRVRKSLPVPLAKSQVKGHWRVNAAGRMEYVKPYTDKRTKKQQAQATPQGGLFGAPSVPAKSKPQASMSGEVAGTQAGAEAPQAEEPKRPTMGMLSGAVPDKKLATLLSEVSTALTARDSASGGNAVHAALEHLADAREQIPARDYERVHTYLEDADDYLARMGEQGATGALPKHSHSPTERELEDYRTDIAPNDGSEDAAAEQAQTDEDAREAAEEGGRAEAAEKPKALSYEDFREQTHFSALGTGRSLRGVVVGLGEKNGKWIFDTTTDATSEAAAKREAYQVAIEQGFIAATTKPTPQPAAPADATGQTTMPVSAPTSNAPAKLRVREERVGGTLPSQGQLAEFYRKNPHLLATVRDVPDGMGYAAFRKQFPAVRGWSRDTVEQAQTRGASRKLGFRQRQALGDYHYSHPMAPGVFFDTAKQATTHAHRLAMEHQAKGAGGVRKSLCGIGIRFNASGRRGSE